uniref:Uncharacterized protein n=1 Tax=Scleropages formosus TaxID=113540 RepID=A0A8C9W247_SCLFO
KKKKHFIRQGRAGEEKGTARMIQLAYSSATVDRTKLQPAEGTAPQTELVDPRRNILQNNLRSVSGTSNIWHWVTLN